MRNVYVLFSLILLSSCLDDKLPLPNTTGGCPEVYEQLSQPYPNYIRKGAWYDDGCVNSVDFLVKGKYCYSEVCLNPGNPYQMCFLRCESNPLRYNKDLCVYDMCTNEVNILSSDAAYNIDWSIKDWIVFTGIDQQLWKVKSNGDSLIRLTNTTDYNGGAKWNKSGTQLLYYDSSAGVGKRTISDENAQNPITINTPLSSWNWVNDSLVIYRLNNDGIGLFHLNNNSTSIISSTPYHNHGGYHTTRDGRYTYFALSTGVYRIDMSTYEITMISQGYDTYIPVLPLISNDKLILQRVLQDTLQGQYCKAWIRYTFSISDADGSNEKQLIIPE